MSNATLKKPFFTYGNDIPTYIPTSVIKSAKILASKCIAYFNVNFNFNNALFRKKHLRLYLEKCCFHFFEMA